MEMEGFKGTVLVDAVTAGKFSCKHVDRIF
jgi:hypothetical protein